MVKVTSERIPDSQVRLEIEVEPERIQQSVEKAFRRLVGRLNVPGFRRGKAPRHLVERMVGKEALFQEGLEDLVGEVYSQAVKDLDLRPVAQPDVDLEPKAADLKPGEPLTLKATVTVVPEIDLGDYRSIRVQPLVTEVTDLEVNQLVDRIREDRAEWVALDRPVAAGDRITADVHGEVGAYTQLYSATGEPLIQSGSGRAIVDDRAVVQMLDPSMSRYPRGVFEQVVGMTPGQEKQFEISIPSDYSDAELANRLAIFRVKLVEAKEKRLPAIDDDLAKAAGFDSFDQMREGLRESARARAERQAREAFENAVLGEAVSRSTFEVPAVLIEREMDHLFEHAKENVERQGIEFATFLRITKRSESEVRADFREQALNSVRTTLVLDRIAEVEQLAVLPEDVDREIELLVSVAGTQGQRVRQSLSSPEQRERLGRRIGRRKVADFLIEIARSGVETAAEVPVGGSESRADESDGSTAVTTDGAEAPLEASRDVAESGTELWGESAVVGVGEVAAEPRD